MGEDDLLGGSLGLAIDAQGMDMGGLEVIALAAIKDEVGGQENQGDVRGDFGELGGDIDVYFFGEGGILLAGGGFAEGGAMDDEVRLVPFKGAADGGAFGKVEMMTGEADDVVLGHEGGRALEKVAADESSCSSNEDGAL